MKDTGIRIVMIGTFQAGRRRNQLSVRRQFSHQNSPASIAIRKILKEDVYLSLMLERERIGPKVPLLRFNPTKSRQIVSGGIKKRLAVLSNGNTPVLDRFLKERILQCFLQKNRAQPADKVRIPRMPINLALAFIWDTRDCPLPHIVPAESV